MGAFWILPCLSALKSSLHLHDRHRSDSWVCWCHLFGLESVCSFFSVDDGWMLVFPFFAVHYITHYTQLISCSMFWCFEWSVWIEHDWTASLNMWWNCITSPEGVVIRSACRAYPSSPLDRSGILKIHWTSNPVKSWVLLEGDMERNSGGLYLGKSRLGVHSW